MSRYRVIKTVDLAGDEEFLVTPEPMVEEFTNNEAAEIFDTPPYVPYWFDSELAWGAHDFMNPAIYASVEELIVDVPEVRRGR